MEFRSIVGAEGNALTVSVIGLGCNNFGRRLDERDSRAVIHAALYAVITLFDTAESHGGGRSENYIGKAPGDRCRETVIATKFGWSDARPRTIASAVEGSLKRLRTDVIDLYQFHRPDPSTPIADTLEALETLVAQGEVRFVGCSNFSGDQIAETRAVSDARGWCAFVTTQNRHSLLDRDAELHMAPACAAAGMGILPYYPLANGLLTGKYGRPGHAGRGCRPDRSPRPSGRRPSGCSASQRRRAAARSNWPSPGSPHSPASSAWSPAPPRPRRSQATPRAGGSLKQNSRQSTVSLDRNRPACGTVVVGAGRIRCYSGTAAFSERRSMTFATNTADRPVAVSGRPVIDPADWTGAELLSRNDWRFEATDAESAHLVDMARACAARLNGDPNRLLETSRSDFNLGPFTEQVTAMLDRLRDDPGVAFYRGLPMDDLSLMEAAVVYWAIGLHMGVAQSNNPEGDMIGHVLDAGRDYNNPKHRGYQTSATMDYHCDQTDAVGLLCIHTAKSGGQSKIASSVRLYNEVQRQRPDLLDALIGPFCWTKHAEQDADEQPWYESPVFNFLDGRLCTALGPQHIMKGHALAEAPDMTPLQREAINFVSALAEEHHAAMSFRRGDIQFLNNYTVVHTRTGFIDWPEPERKRVLWRLWLKVPEFRPATPYSAQWSRGVNLRQTQQQIQLVYSG